MVSTAVTVHFLFGALVVVTESDAPGGADPLVGDQ